MIGLVPLGASIDVLCCEDLIGCSPDGSGFAVRNLDPAQPLGLSLRGGDVGD
jgi:hypothetical protein